MNNLIIVGSFAALQHKAILPRKPMDIDVISDWESALSFAKSLGKVTEIRQVNSHSTAIFTDKIIVEAELIERREHSAKLLKRMKQDSPNSIIATPEWLYFLKMSHRYKKDSPHFFKTLKDAHTMRRFGVKMPEGSEELFKEREKLTYTNKLPKLNVSTGDFFKQEDGIYIYDHDSIHEVVALDGEPAYTKYMKAGAQVMTNAEAFFAQPERVRLLGGLEEAMVLAAERSLIPHNFKPNPDKMFEYALSKVCTSITGGYFREYCWDNYFKIMDIYNKECKGSWWKEVKYAVENNGLRPYNPGK